ncbi:MAG: Gfo/Idh/MocA family protein [Novosphingobium sp.]|uniref:Gfo/Idh/MocA family protein n=1 Tax=Novosphingobium sp. TaxID=1874826 RepID=UPI003B9C73DB
MAGQSIIRWGILGPGGIARDFLAGTQGSQTGRIVAICARNPDDPALARNFPGIRVAGDYDALLRDDEVDAVYIATPHPHHARWAIAAAEHGKHVLCEKPLGMNLAEVRAMFGAAQKAGRFLAEAYMYRVHPLTQAIVDLVAKGTIGDVRMVRSGFGFAMPNANPSHRLFAPALGGGGILDVGGYPLSMARLIAGIGTPDGVMEPDSFHASAHIGATGVDEWSAAVLSFPNGMIAQIASSISVWQDNVLEIMGTTGRIEVDSFWFASGKGGGETTIRVQRPDGIRPDGLCEEIRVDDPRNLYSFQFEAANRAISEGATGLSWPAMTAADSIANAQALDRWLAAAGVHTGTLS